LHQHAASLPINCTGTHASGREREPYVVPSGHPIKSGRSLRASLPRFSLFTVTNVTANTHHLCESSRSRLIPPVLTRCRIARFTRLPSRAPVRYEHALHSGLRLDSALIMSSVQPSRLAVCRATTWPATNAPDWA